MFSSNKRAVLAGILSFICVLATGCGVASESMQESGAQGRQTSSGRESGAQGQQTSVRSESGTQKRQNFWNGSFYCLSDLFEMVEEKNIFAGACIQVLNPPYEQWESQAYFYQWDDGIGMRVDTLAGVAEDGVLLGMRSNTDEKFYLACLHRDGTLEALMEISEDFMDGFWYQEGEQLQVLSGGGRMLTAFDQAGQQGTTRNLAGKVIGFLENPQDGGKAWYGFEGDELVLWDKPGGQIQARVTDQINQFKDFGIGYDALGELFLAEIGRAHV